MINFPEAGYTPANLNALLDYAGLNIKQFSELLDIKYRSAQNYTYSTDNPNHQDMPLQKWNELLSKIQGQTK